MSRRLNKLPATIITNNRASKINRGIPKNADMANKAHINNKSRPPMIAHKTAKTTPNTHLSTIVHPMAKAISMPTSQKNRYRFPNNAFNIALIIILIIAKEVN